LGDADWNVRFEMFGEILTRDIVDHGLRAGDIGTVAERHVVAGVLDVTNLTAYASSTELSVRDDMSDCAKYGQPARIEPKALLTEAAGQFGWR
jgi:hypothetical protein